MDDVIERSSLAIAASDDLSDLCTIKAVLDFVRFIMFEDLQLHKLPHRRRLEYLQWHLQLELRLRAVDVSQIVFSRLTSGILSPQN
jgi:hypothetical protein